MSSLDSVVVSRVAEQLKLDVGIVARALKLLRDGLPVSYLSRYRRDGVGGLDESTLREMRTAAERVLEMEQRREFILRAVGERKDVSDKMRRRIERCRSRLELEYLYEPFRPPRKTPGSIARARGLESLAEAGVKLGLPRETATLLAAQTAKGAAEQVLATGAHPALLKDEVTTPAGCTIDGLLELEEGKLRVTLIKAVVKAAERAKELFTDSAKSDQK